MTTSWRCHQCEAGETGTNWAALDKAAERHCRETKHATTTTTTGARRVRDEAGSRDLRPAREAS